MIANINPSSHTYEDTHNTLKYSNRAKNIKVNPVQRELVREGNWVEREVRLKEENNYLRNKVSELEAVVIGLREQVELLKSTHSTSSLSSSTASVVAPVGQVKNRVSFATTASTTSSAATGTVEMPCEATHSHYLASDREVREEERRDSIIYENNISLMLDTIPEEEDGGSSYGTDSRRTSYTTNESSKGALPRTPYTPSHYIFDMLGDEEVDHMRHTLSDSVLKAGLLSSLDDSTHPTPYRNSIRDSVSNSTAKDITSPRYRLSQSVAGSKRKAPVSYSSTSNSATATADTSHNNTHTEREQKEERESSVVHVPTVKKLAFSPVASTAHNSVNKSGSSDNMDNNTSIILDTNTQVQEIADNTIESARKRRRTSHIPTSKIPSTTTKRVVKSTIIVPIDPASSTSTIQHSVLPAQSSPVPTPPASSSTAITSGITTTATGLATNGTVGVSKVTTRSRRQTFVDATQSENVNPQILPHQPSQLIDKNNDTSNSSANYIQVEKVQKPPTGNSRRRSMEGIKAMLDSLPLTGITTSITDLTPTYSTVSTVPTIDSAHMPEMVTGVITRSRRSSLMAPKLTTTTITGKKGSVITDVTDAGEGLSTTTTSTTGRASNRRQSSASTYTTRRMI